MNIFYLISIMDIYLIFLFYFIGKWADDKEMKTTWKDAKAMEIKKARKLAKEWEKNNPILNFFQDFYYDCNRIKDLPYEIKDDIKYFIQRGKKGYSRRDVWGFNCYLTNIMTEGLKDLQEMVNGFPSNMSSIRTFDIEEEKKGVKEWKKIIGKIIWTFEAIQKIENYEWILVAEENKREEYKKHIKNLNKLNRELLFDNLSPHKYHLMTKEEMKKYYEGWDLLKKYYFDLWD